MTVTVITDAPLAPPPPQLAESNLILHGKYHTTTLPGLQRTRAYHAYVARLVSHDTKLPTAETSPRASP